MDTSEALDTPDTPEVPDGPERKFRWEPEDRGRELVVVPRAEWGGPPLLECEYWEKPMLQHPIANVILTYTESDYCYGSAECKRELRRLHDEAVAKGMWTVPYNFVVGGDGTVYEARGWRRKPERSDVFPNLWGESIEIAHFGRRGKPPQINQITGSWNLTLFGIVNKYFSKRKIMPERHHIFI